MTRASLHCETCGAPSHPAAACTLSAPLPPASVTDKQSPAMPYHLPSAAPPPSITPKPALDHPSILGPLPKGTDRRGRPVLYQGGRMICNNFNILGCSSSSCKFLHTCSFCGGAHARATCPHNPTKQQLYINSLIPSLDFSMQYATIDHAISLIHLVGQGAWLPKADITSAFKVLPIHPDYWHLFGVSWKDTLIYHLKRSKTNQSGQPQPIYLFHLDPYISLYEPIHEYINTRLAN
eukprot:superscaffoldBa00000047_g810